MGYIKLSIFAKNTLQKFIELKICSRPKPKSNLKLPVIFNENAKCFHTA